MAEALLRRELRRAGVDAAVSSCGELVGGVPATAGAANAMAKRGLDLSTHRSSQLAREILDESDLVLAMARTHAREAIVLVPDVFPRTFTLRELVRRGRGVGPRRKDEPFEAWLSAVHAGRTRLELLGNHAADDIVDPMGGPAAGYERTARILEELIADLVELAFPARS